MRWPGEARAAERFARAVDAGPDANRPGADRPDTGAAGSDGDVAGLVAVVERLRVVDGAADPAPEFRARLRERLVDTAATEWATDPPGAAAAEPASAPADLRAGRPRARLRPRLVLSGALAMVLLVGGLVLASGSALPGDALYPVKRSTEQVELAFTFGQQAKGHRYLAMARTRTEEIRALLNRTASGRPADAGTVSATLDAMDAETTAGTRLLSTVGVQEAADRPLAYLAGWSAEQHSLVSGLLNQLPEPARPRAGDSLDLLRRVAERAAALRAQLSCSCLGTAGTDEFGPRPCTPCAAGGAQPGSPAPSSPPALGTRGGTSSAGAPPSGGTPGAGSGVPSAGTGGSPSTGGGGGPPVPLPTGSGGLPPASVPGVPLPTQLPLPTQVPLPPLPIPSLTEPSLPGLPLPTAPLPLPS